MQRVSYMDFKILNFTIFCVNNVASYLNKSAKDVYHAMQNAGLIDGYIVPCYDVLHSFSKEYIVDDLVSLMRQKGARIVKLFAEQAGLSYEEALGKFYDSTTYDLISNGIADMHCFSDEYLADELLIELGYKQKMT